MTRTVLVTGGTGFVGGWVVRELLRRGDHVRTTVRDPARADDVRAAVDAGDELEVVQADLLADDGWAAAADGCDAVLHVASPLTPSRDEQQLIRPAVDGTLRVLRAARDAGVRRVVYTSSCAAVYYGYPARSAAFTEADWTDVEGTTVSAYVKSKAFAERAAWDWVEDFGDALELTAVNPTGIFGPALTASAGSSLGLIRRMLSGRPRLLPDLHLCIVDVRDVVDLHLRALDAPEAAGERFVANGSEPVPMKTVAKELRSRLGERAEAVPTRVAPDRLVRALGRVDPQIGSLVPLLGQRRRASWDKARDRLGWSPRPWQDAVVASAESLLALDGARPVAA